MSLLERKEKIQDILISSLGVFIAGLIGSLIILTISLLIGSKTDIFSNLYNSKFSTKIEVLYPILLSFITLIGTSIASLITYKMLGSTNPERYKKNNVIFSQVAIFQVLVYIFIAPVYLFYGGNGFENIMITYILHILIVIFGTNLILDILNNYRYIIISIYGNFIGLFISIFITILIFNLFSDGYAKLISLVFLLPIINMATIFFKKVFELAYFHFYRITGSDPIGDIFYKIKKEDEENEKEENEKSML